MIQRKQTIWLLLSLLAWAVLFYKPVFGFTAENQGPWMLHAIGIKLMETGTTVIPAIPLLILYALVDLLTLASVFLYKYLALQMRITLYTMILQILTYALIGFYVFVGIRQLDADPKILFFSIIPLIAFFFSLMAFRGIRTDFLLLKTFRRLR